MEFRINEDLRQRGLQHGHIQEKEISKIELPSVIVQGSEGLNRIVDAKRKTVTDPKIVVVRDHGLEILDRKIIIDLKMGFEKDPNLET